MDASKSISPLTKCPISISWMNPCEPKAIASLVTIGLTNPSKMGSNTKFINPSPITPTILKDKYMTSTAIINPDTG